MLTCSDISSLCMPCNPCLTVRGKLDDTITNPAANRPITQRLSLVLASMAASDGAGAGAQLVQYAMQLSQPAAGTTQVTGSCTLHSVAANSLTPYHKPPASSDSCTSPLDVCRCRMSYLWCLCSFSCQQQTRMLLQPDTLI